MAILPVLNASAGAVAAEASILRNIPLSDVSFLLISLAALAGIIGFFVNRGSQKRKEDRTDAAERTERIMNEIKKSHGDSARDVRELSDKVKDGRTVLEKDIEQIKSVHRHDAANIHTLIQSLTHIQDKSADEVSKLRDRMTAAETNGKHQNEALNKLESTVREKIDEMKDLIKQQGETSTAQFKELATSIREARDVKLK